MTRTKTLEQRYWEKVDKNGPTMPHMTTPCWEWMGRRNDYGYGDFNVNNRCAKAHRVGFQLEYGPIPQGLQVCHKCDNPSCQNPDHLFLGTNYDNAQDRELKGRGHDKRGEKNGRAKLIRSQIIEIVNLKGKERIRITAARYGVSYATVNEIQSKKIWGWLTNELESVQ